MARMPGAVWRPLGKQTEPRLTKRNKVILHTMVGSLSGTDSYFRQQGYSGSESHFGVGGDGTIYQWQDTDWQADAQVEGNDDCISIETADHGPEFPSWSGSNVPAWTNAQLEAIARILAWCHETHGIPLSLIPNTLDSTRGVGYHRQGIDPYRTHGEKYSSAYGKVCPGDRRVAQIPGLMERAKQIVDGTQEDDMPLDAKDAKTVWYEKLLREYADEDASGKRELRSPADILLATHRAALIAANPNIDKLAAAIVAKMPPGAATLATVRQGVREVLGSLDDDPA